MALYNNCCTVWPLTVLPYLLDAAVIEMCWNCTFVYQLCAFVHIIFEYWVVLTHCIAFFISGRSSDSHLVLTCNDAKVIS